MSHQIVLEDRLTKSGNDPELAKIILSYLHPCMICKNHCINVKNYYVEDCANYIKFYKDWRVIYMCYDCMVDVMLNHPHGKNGVLTYEEHQKEIYRYNWVSESFISI